MAGTPSLSQVEAEIAGRLSQYEFAVRRQHFKASPRSLVAVASAGAASGWVVLILAPLLMVVDLPGWPVALTGFAALLLGLLLVLGIADGVIPTRHPEVNAVNICAQRQDEPQLWLVAHCDSKSQGISLAGRVFALGALGTGLVLFVVALGARVFAPLPWWAIAPAVLLTVAGGSMLSRRALSNDSPGAVDNATGVLAVLVAVEHLQHRRDVGVLITGAEEFAMAGARAWVAARGAAGSFINIDGIDSRGRHRVTKHRPRASSAQRSREIADAVTDALTGAGVDATQLGLPPGVLEDGVALSRGGMAGVTLSRGDWQTLRVVHTKLDRPERIDVAAAVTTGAAVAQAVDVLLG
ncbi:MAG: M20/M25/M40 family metallo-hydrolase [Gemmatimonadota bacterium]|nr:MAG: M20/M25/M40 family metallo-hydrolase [Gemmatimonadota bacterium]